IVLEPLLMAAAALLLGFGSSGISSLGVLALVFVCGGIHPRCLNPILQRLSQAKLKTLERWQTRSPEQALPNASASASMTAPQSAAVATLKLQRYPIRPFLGELIFLVIRSLGFALTVFAIYPLKLGQVPHLVSSFSFAWLMGMVIPGAPGGIGVFESIAVALLSADLTTSVILSAVAIYRLVNTLGEAIAAGLAQLLRPTADASSG
ncbi:MAG: hypothetical protein AAGF24_12005, partial [Cyanobacteria bacterium P01_H01_bin.121]